MKDFEILKDFTLAAAWSPDSQVIKQGIIQCTSAILRVLDTTICFDEASATISINSVLKCLKKPPVPKGTAKLVALEKFKGLKYQKPKKTLDDNIKTLMKRNNKNKKIRDPLDDDKTFLKELVNELDTFSSSKTRFVLI